MTTLRGKQILFSERTLEKLNEEILMDFETESDEDFEEYVRQFRPDHRRLSWLGSRAQRQAEARTNHDVLAAALHCSTRCST